MNPVQDTLNQLTDEELSELLEVNSREYPDETVHLARLEAYKRWGSILPQKDSGVRDIGNSLDMLPRHESELGHVPKSPQRNSAMLAVLFVLFALAAFLLGVRLGKSRVTHTEPAAIVLPLPTMTILRPREEISGPDTQDKQNKTPQEIFDAYNKAVVLLRFYDGHGRRVGMVTGFNIAQDGLVVVPLHALQGQAVSADVMFPTYGKFKVAGVAGVIDEAVDLAFLKVNGNDFPAISGGHARSVALEDKVFLIGNPQGLINTLLAGNIRTIREISGMKQYEIRMLPNVSAGDGSLVLKESGEMLGIFSHAVCIPIEEMERIQPFHKIVPLDEISSYLESNIR